MVIKLSTCCDRCPSVTSSVICVKVCSYDGATRRASPREGNGGFPDFRRQRENKLENKNLSKKRIRFLKRANNQIEILKIIYYLFSIFKKKSFFQDWGLFLLKSTSSSKMVFKKKTALCSTRSNLKSNTDKLPDKRFVERFSTGPHSKPKKQPCQ